MKFIPIESNFIYVNQPYLKDNNIYSDPDCYSDTVLQFGGWGQELDIDSHSKTATSFSAIFSKKEITETSLNIPNFIDAKIIIEDLTHIKKPFRIYYDKCTGWFCFGNKDSLRTGYRFAIDTIAVINNGLLEAIFIHPIEKNDKHIIFGLLR